MDKEGNSHIVRKLTMTFYIFSDREKSTVKLWYTDYDDDIELEGKAWIGKPVSENKLQRLKEILNSDESDAMKLWKAISWMITLAEQHFRLRSVVNSHYMRLLSSAAERSAEVIA